MKDFINKLYRNHSLIYKGLLFICATFLIVYLFPKSGKFKYNFEKGKPWQSENLYAPFNFAIKKTDDEIALEKKLLVENSLLYFTVWGFAFLVFYILVKFSQSLLISIFSFLFDQLRYLNLNFSRRWGFGAIVILKNISGTAIFFSLCTLSTISK